MDRKNRVWLIVLIVLLIAAVTGMILVKNRLSASETNYAAVSAQLTDVQTSAQTAQLKLTLNGAACKVSDYALIAM